MRRSAAYVTAALDLLAALLFGALAILWLKIGDGPGVGTVCLFATCAAFAGASAAAMRRRGDARWQAAPWVVIAACVAWVTIDGRIRDRRVAAYEARLRAEMTALAPRLPAMAAALAPPPGGPVRGGCVSPLKDFPTCFRDDGGIVLLLSAPAPDLDATSLEPLEGLAWTPRGAPVQAIGEWYIGSLLEPLGAGWYHVRAYPGAD